MLLEGGAYLGDVDGVVGGAQQVARQRVVGAAERGAGGREGVAGRNYMRGRHTLAESQGQILRHAHCRLRLQQYNR